ncbi:transposase [Ardenticatena maritima]|nr:transposase [Ardenticatena maritima]KPL89058.1 transposase [Ardenticatena maritima]
MPPYDPNRHHRRSIRLKGYDYTQPGAYFVTICTHERAHLFGRVVDGEMVLNAWGEIVRDEWFRTADIRANVELYADEFVVMPNHVHGIIWIVETDLVGAQRRCAPTGPSPGGITPNNVAPGSLGAIVRAFKSAVTRRINIQRNTPGGRIWQRNYYEHIIRTQRALHAIRRYIADNPRRWHLDRHNPTATAADPRAGAVWRLLQESDHTDHPDDTEASL